MSELLIYFRYIYLQTFEIDHIAQLILYFHHLLIHTFLLQFLVLRE